MKTISQKTALLFAGVLACASGIGIAQTVVIDGGNVSARTEGATVDLRANGTTRVQTRESRTSSDGDEPLAKNASGKTIVIDGVSKSVNTACNGKSVEVLGSDNKVRLSGYCAKVLVDGTSNHVTVAQVGVVNVEGASNTVAWREKAHGKAPKVSSDGVDNRVYQLK